VKKQTGVTVSSLRKMVRDVSVASLCVHL